MSYSQVVRGVLTRSGAIKEIDSQAELELGRPLTDGEKASIFSRLNPQNVVERIVKVNANFVFPLPKLSFFSMVMDL